MVQTDKGRAGYHRSYRIYTDNIEGKIDSYGNGFDGRLLFILFLDLLNYFLTPKYRKTETI